MKKFLFGALCALSVASLNAADFFSTEKCDDFITFGARVGVNTTNRTISGSAFPAAFHNETWGTGFSVGVVADLNIRDYLSIQPGVFFDTRSGRYALAGTAVGSGLETICGADEYTQLGKRNSYNLTIPIMAVMHFNIVDEVRWNVEFGPYLAILLDSKNKVTHLMSGVENPVPLFTQTPASVDFGFKMGTGFEIFDHYYIGAHYMAGCISAWKELKIDNLKKNFGGLTKGWTFTIGYNF